ncbi:hypothetical protein [Burkholderia sp. Ac-20344]|uniref:hypothetical protein n=1 Tax=Burkholderia sp. Ac-20344 TaxID=2703890 RepID=UPI00197C9F3A|nr:hypothetical protein [Burkholderia sp. Ac-20344]MBN3834458.1 hypothetical protein [Burkholderia sp. Ac-20344]
MPATRHLRRPRFRRHIRFSRLDLVNRKVLGYLELDRKAMPQDIGVSPDGKVRYVADLMADGVYVVEGDRFTNTGNMR